MRYPLSRKRAEQSHEKSTALHQCSALTTHLAIVLCAEQRSRSCRVWRPRHEHLLNGAMLAAFLVQILNHLDAYGPLLSTPASSLFTVQIARLL